ncbi:MAG TPA: hypothetical protein PKE30_07380 [Niabella sp.]|nr:hypothetical protein [Niabella sp.]
MRKYFCLQLTLCFTSTIFSQDYIGQKSYGGISLGTFTYTGMYSKNASFVSHTSMSGSVFYDHRLILDRQLFVKGELLLGEIAGNNMDKDKVTSENPLKGGFRGYVVEGSAKVEYELMNLYRHRISPYISAGVGAYYLFDYEFKQGEPKTAGESWGIVAPVGGGVKFRLNKRVRLFAAGHYRFFARNFDNFPDETVKNPNRYYTLVAGASFALQKFNRLW